MATVESLLLRLRDHESRSPLDAEFVSSVDEALELLSDPECAKVAPAFRLRQRCFQPLKLAFDSGQADLVKLAVDAVQLMWHDGRFHSSMASEIPAMWTGAQVIEAVQSALNLPADLQLTTLEMLQRMIYGTVFASNAKVVVDLYELCKDIYLSRLQTPATRAKSLSVTRSALESFADLTERSNGAGFRRHDDDDALADLFGVDLNSVDSLVGDSVEIAKRLLEDVAEGVAGREAKGDASTISFKEDLLVFSLEALRRFLAKIPASVSLSPSPFNELVWRDLCPKLVGALGAPTVASPRSPAFLHELDKSGAALENSEGRENVLLSIHKISVELLRICGGVESLRPVLQALFHRILFNSPPFQRRAALETFSEILGDARLIATMVGPPVVNDDDPGSQSSAPTAAQNPLTDVAILKLMLDGAADLVDAVADDDDAASSCLLAATASINRLLISLKEILTNEKKISAKRMTQLGKFYLGNRETVDDRDERIDDDDDDVFGKSTKENEKQKSLSPSSTSKTHLPSRQNPPSESDLLASELGLRASAYVARESTSSDSAPKLLVDGLSGDDADRFVEELMSLVPRLNRCEDSTEADETLLEFASTFCHGVMGDSQKQFQCVTILNADGLYILACHCLRLYLSSADGDLIISAEEFQREIFEGGALVFLTSAWIASVYRRIVGLRNRRFSGDGGHVISFDPRLIEFLTKFERESCPFSPPHLPSESYTPAHFRIASALVKRVLRTCLGPIVGVLHRSSTACRVVAPSSSSLAQHALLPFNAWHAWPKERLKKSRALAHSAAFGFDGLLELSRLTNEAHVATIAFKHLEDASSVKPRSFSPPRLHASFSSLPPPSDVAFEEKPRETFQSHAFKVLEKRLPENLSKGFLAAALRRDAEKWDKKDQESETPRKKDRESETPRKEAIVSVKGVHVNCLHASPVFCLEVVAKNALDLGRDFPSVWGPIIKSCLHLFRVERAFCKTNDAEESKTISNQRLQTGLASSLKKIALETAVGENLESAVEDFVETPYGVKSEPFTVVIADILENSGPTSLQEPDLGGCLPISQTSLILMYFTSRFDMLFDLVTRTYSASALCDFLRELGSALKESLSSKRKEDRESEVSSSILLQRLSDSIIQICQSETRPLFHVLKCWSVAQPFLLAAATSRDASLSSKAVETLYEVVATMLVRVKERKYFHLHEAFVKPFETILCLESEPAVQSQTLTVLCALVEGYAEELGSGWKPLFAALRHVHFRFFETPERNGDRVQPVLDVFRAFFGTGKVGIFANAALDCVLCLLKYLRGGGAIPDKDLYPPTNKDPYSDSETDDDDTDDETDNLSPGADCLCLPAFQFLKETSDIFSSMYKMLNCPTFPAAHWIKLSDIPQNIDSSIPHVSENLLFQRFSLPLEEDEIFRPNSSQEISKDDEDVALDLRPLDDEDESRDNIYSDDGPDSRTIGDLDQGTGILHVWYLLVEGVASSVTLCPRVYQPRAVQLLFDILNGLADCPGPRFSIYCIDTLLLPMIQFWLRKETTDKSGLGDSYLMNLKQCFGLATNSIADLMIKVGPSSSSFIKKDLAFMTKQFLEVVVEGIAAADESISRLACSCLKHLFVEGDAAADFSPEVWSVACRALRRAVHVSLYPLKRLMTCFSEGSENFYGDARRVRVGARRDCSAAEARQLRQLARRVFLVESQRIGEMTGSEENDAAPLMTSGDETMRSFVFLLYDRNDDDDEDDVGCFKRLPNFQPDEAVEFRRVVLGLLAHQLVVQTIGGVLLRGCGIAPDETIFAAATTIAFEDRRRFPRGSEGLSTTDSNLLLDALEESTNVAHDFDARPGLKILLQNVVGARVALNLYSASSVSFLLYFHSLLREARFNKSFLRRLRKGVKEQTQRYIDFQLDKFGREYIADALAKKPLFFLLAKFDDLSEFKLKSLMGGSKEEEADEEDDDENDEDENDDPEETKDLSLKENVYTPATEEDVESLTSEYKKRKGQRAMPGAPRVYGGVEPFRAAGRSRRHLAMSGVMAGLRDPMGAPLVKSPEAMEKEICRVRKEKSLIDDSAARHDSLVAALNVVFGVVVSRPSDGEFEALVPCLFESANQLVTHATDPKLKENVSLWFKRLGEILDLAPQSDSE